MEKVQYAEMLPHEIVTRRKKFPAAFIGLGALEWQSEHLAVGSEALQAEKLCELAAERSGGFAFPGLWWGEPRTYKLMEFSYDQEGIIKSKMEFRSEKFSESYFGKSAEQQVQFYQELLYHVLVQMNTSEMRAVCLFCGHTPLRDFALPVVERFNTEFKDTQAFAGTETDYVAGLAMPRDRKELNKGILKEGEYVGEDHASKWKTSYLWYLRPDCVDMSIYLNRMEEPLIGTLGMDPRKEASVELGRRACHRIVEAMVRKSHQLLNQTDRD